MAIYTIKVSLAVKDGKNTLVLTPTFCEVDLDPNTPSRIVWILDDGATDAYFVVRSGRNGILFDWEDTPGKGVFGTFDVDSGKKTISTQDNHSGTGNFGRWRYKLRVKQGTIIYTTPSGYATPSGSGGSKKVGDTIPGDRGDHPIIINR
jgi:hypothetical protein